MELLHIQENPRVLDNVALLVLLTLCYWFPKCGPGTSGEGGGVPIKFQEVPSKKRETEFIFPLISILKIFIFSFLCSDLTGEGF